MNTVTIPREIKNDDLVVLPRKAYERLVGNLPTFVGYETVSRKKKKYRVPLYQLHGKAAERLDRRVEQAFHEYKAGKIIVASSVREASRKYEKSKRRGKN